MSGVHRLTKGETMEPDWEEIAKDDWPRNWDECPGCCALSFHIPTGLCVNCD